VVHEWGEERLETKGLRLVYIAIFAAILGAISLSHAAIFGVIFRKRL
jgi:hypothetical protein